MKKATRFFAVVLAAACVSTTVLPQNVGAASWEQSPSGWWYQEDNGSYPKNQWKKISSRWYWFDANGYMVTGWKKISGNWYYLQSDGAMLERGWHKIGSRWDYIYKSGIMASNTWIGDDYVDANGVWIPGKVRYQEGWVKSGSRWWYRHADGGYTKNGWEKINGQYYLFDSNGYMLNGWQKVKGTWYYLQSSGAMMGRGWHQINGNWYYMYDSGAMAANTWIGEYYVNDSGVRVESKKEYDLLEVCPPYKTQRYEKWSNLSMAGIEYNSGISIGGTGYWGETGYALFNLSGKYTTLSFTVGNIDSRGVAWEESLSIYLDGELAWSIDLDPYALPVQYTVKVAGAKQMKMEGSLWAGDFGIVNLKIK